MWLISDFIKLLYPLRCACCGDSLVKNEKIICTHCLIEFPRTRFHQQEDNMANQLFWGRVQVEKATSLYYYFKGSKYQRLIYLLKYKGRKEIGIELGKMLGGELKRSGFIEGVDALIPVPLHPKKEKLRGYNQSYMICKGIQEVTDIPINNKTLFRSYFTDTQTSRTRLDRYDNVQNAFVVKYTEKIKGKHVLLIDDILTTGATIEACTKEILNISDTKVSVACLGISVN